MILMSLEVIGPPHDWHIICETFVSPGQVNFHRHLLHYFGFLAAHSQPN